MMDDFELSQLMQAAVDAMVEAGWDDAQIQDEMAVAIERAREE